jgi:hypothetical protein
MKSIFAASRSASADFAWYFALFRKGMNAG